MTNVPEEVVRLARDARRVTVLTGAGMSAESGVPTFRDNSDSLWSRFDPTELATAEAFEADPAHVYTWYLWRMARLHEVEPNAGHRALADWGTFADVRIVTQNVDDLHERAGSAVLTHLHGSLVAFRCYRCDTTYAGEVHPPDHLEGRIDPPACQACGGPIRPGVVWFGEMLPEGAFDTAVEAVQSSDVVLSVGTSGIVQPAAMLPDLAGARGIPVIELNPDETTHSSSVRHAWRTTAAVGLPALVEAIRPTR